MIYIAGPFFTDKERAFLKIVIESAKEVFPNEWKSPIDNILWKTTGFRAVIYALPFICRRGIRKKVVTKDFFIRCFTAFKNELKKRL